MVGKKGLDYELGVVVRDFEKDGIFTLLHDLTTCLRIGDATRCDPGQYTIVEVKAGPRSDAAQDRRMEDALAFVNHGGPLRLQDRSPYDVRVSSVQLKTLIRPYLANMADEAADALYVARAVERHRVLTALSLRGVRSQATVQQGLALTHARRAKAIRKAGLDGVLHALQFTSADTTARVPHFAPFSVFPLPVDVQAALICDYLAYESILAFDRLQQALEGQGFVVECLLRPQNEADMVGDVLRAYRGRRSAVLHHAAILQLHMELIDVDRYAEALSDQFDGGSPMPGVLLFSNEHGQWR
jgi:hypothetical protein